MNPSFQISKSKVQPPACGNHAHHPMGRSLSGPRQKPAHIRILKPIFAQSSVKATQTTAHIGFTSGETNIYGYVANDPVNWVDPSGLDSEIIKCNSKWGHQVLRIFDPKMPGNNVYVDFSPISDNFVDLLTVTSGTVEINNAAPKGEVIEGSHRNLSTKQTSELLVLRPFNFCRFCI